MSLSPDILDLLKNVSLFSGLSNEVLTRHLDHSNRITLTAGKTLLTPGDAYDNVYVVLSGRLRVSPDSSNNDPIAIVGAGEAVGETSILNANKALDYLIAETDCELLCINLATIWSLLNGSHHAAINMLNILSQPITMSKHSNQNGENQQGYAGLNQVDELTGLYNRDWMTKMFERQIRRLAITHDHAVLMMVSIDQFDHYNQSHGLLGGDQALRTIAQTILTCLRPDDQAGRYYGKVFAVFMSNTTLEEARKAGQRLLLQTSQALIVTPGGDALPHVTISIGMIEAREGVTPQELFEQAAEALQRAKLAGGNCIGNPEG